MKQEIVKCTYCNTEFKKEDECCPECGCTYIGDLDLEDQLYLTDWYDGGDICI